MKTSTAILAAAIGIVAADGIPGPPIQGFSLSDNDGWVDMNASYYGGTYFLMEKATEGANIIDASWDTNFMPARRNGIMSGGYHIARPDKSTGAQQALFFTNTSFWSDDGSLMPGALNLENNNAPGGDPCYGMDPKTMTTWIQDFVDTYQKNITRTPIIHTSADWWNKCTGNSNAFAQTCVLDLVAYGGTMPTALPGGWTNLTFWENNPKYKFGGQSQIFNGTWQELRTFILGRPERTSRRRRDF